MRGTNQERKSRWLAMILTLLLHGLLLLGAYLFQLTRYARTSSGYSIELQNDGHEESIASRTPEPAPPPSPEPSDLIEEVVVPTELASEKETAPLKQDQTPVKEPSHTPREEDTPSQPKKDDTQKPKDIDKRGLYSTNGDNKQSTALLELAGWVWDSTPQPNDPTNESGRIVFEIKIDEWGEVIAIKTIEKTVSPLIEKIYRESLIQLTFSKANTITDTSSTSTGKITFIIKSR